MDHFDLQSAIKDTVDLATNAPAESPIANDLREHLGALLACQTVRAIEPSAETIKGVLLTADAQPCVVFADTVFDPARNIEWTRRPVSTDRLAFAAAEKACTDCRIGGYADWRLPTREELQSIVDYNRFNPAINPEHFPDTPPGFFWSSSPVASDPDYAWFVDFDSGYVSLHRRDPNAFVRAVRSVPPRQ